MTMKYANSVVKVVSIFLFIAFLANCLITIYQRQVVSRIIYQESHGMYEDDRFLEKIPTSFEPVAMEVQENHMFSLIDDHTWANILPAKRGFLRLGPKGRSFGTALYHQLHCVNALRFSYTVARDGLVTDPEILKAKIDHDNHCFQFLRQNILCSADDSPVQVNRPNISLAQAGFGVTHRCKNWAQIRRFVLENDAKWTDVPYLDEDGIEETME